jgi:hypothetical protein
MQVPSDRLMKSPLERDSSLFVNVHDAEFDWVSWLSCLLVSAAVYPIDRQFGCQLTDHIGRSGELHAARSVLLVDPSAGPHEPTVSCHWITWCASASGVVSGDSGDALTPRRSEISNHQLLHLHHVGVGVRSLHEFAHVLWDDLPAQAKTVFTPTALL